VRMKTRYPFNGKNAGDLYKINEEGLYGHYPISKYGIAHSGIHLNGNSQDRVLAIAPGDIVAYRIKKEMDRDKREGKKDTKFSSCFILMKHQDTAEKLLFFSLYMNLNPDFVPKCFRKKRFWNQCGVSINLRETPNYQKEKGKTPLAEIPHEAELLYLDDEVPTFNRVEKYDIRTNYQVRYRRVMGYREKGKTEIINKPGFVNFTENNIKVENEVRIEKNKVVVLDDPIHVEAGNILGFPGVYRPERERLSNRYFFHLEIFMEKIDFMNNVEGKVTQNSGNFNYYDWKKGKYFYEIYMNSLPSILFKGRAAWDTKDLIIEINALRQHPDHVSIDPKYTSVKNMIDSCQLNPNCNVRRALREIVCNNATQWSFEIARAHIGWNSLSDEQKIHEKAMYWWDDVQTANSTLLPTTSDKLWFVHPIAFIEHMKKIYEVPLLIRAKKATKNPFKKYNLEEEKIVIQYHVALEDYKKNKKKIDVLKVDGEFTIKQNSRNQIKLTREEFKDLKGIYFWSKEIGKAAFITEENYDWWEDEPSTGRLYFPKEMLESDGKTNPPSFAVEFEYISGVLYFILNEIKKNESDEDLKEIQDLNSGKKPNPEYNIPLLGKYSTAELKWAHKVHKNASFKGFIQDILLLGGGEWDYKTVISPIWGEWQRLGNNKEIYFFDVWANLNFGYIGRIAGFTKENLIDKANEAQDFDEGNYDCIDDVLTQEGYDSTKLTLDKVLEILENNKKDWVKGEWLISGRRKYWVDKKKEKNGTWTPIMEKKRIDNVIKYMKREFRKRGVPTPKWYFEKYKTKL